MTPMTNINTKKSLAIAAMLIFNLFAFSLLAVAQTAFGGGSGRGGGRGRKGRKVRYPGRTKEHNLFR